jgi:putative transposase
VSAYQPLRGLDKEEVRSTLDVLARDGAQRMLISALGQEVEEFLGRARYEHRTGRRRGYRNGVGKPRKVAVGCGTLEIQAPRVRDTDVPFSSQLLPRYQRSSEAVRTLLPELYLQGLATGDFEPALRTLLGEAAPLSPTSIVRLKAQWQAEYEAWTRRPLDRRYAYCWADGLYLKAGPADEKTAVLIVIGVTENGQKELLTMVEGYRESRESWRDVLRDLRRRGLKAVRLFIGDGGLGLWAAVEEVYPDARHQLCWCHKMLNVLDKLPQRLQPEARTLVRDIYTAPTRDEAEERIRRFSQRFERDYPRAVASLVDHQTELLTYYDFPREHWKSLRTSNPIESVFDPVRLRTRATRRMRTARTGLYLVFQLVRRAERRWRRIDAPHVVMKGARPRSVCKWSGGHRVSKKAEGGRLIIVAC